jgi:hypothetical protein
MFSSFCKQRIASSSDLHRKCLSNVPASECTLSVAFSMLTELHMGAASKFTKRAITGHVSSLKDYKNHKQRPDLAPKIALVSAHCMTLQVSAHPLGHF